MQSSLKTNKYPCTGCGACCFHVKTNVENAIALLANGDSRTEFLKEVISFPYRYDETGRCENMGDDMKCKVYNNRPDICDVVKTWEKHFSDKVTLPEYFIATAHLCNSMITEAKLDDSYLINPDLIQ